MADDTNKRMVTLLALLDLKEAVARDDVQAAREIREKRLIRVLDSFSADRGRSASTSLGYQRKMDALR
jgi:hypothetical protein